MDDSTSHQIPIEADKGQSTAKAVESLLAGASDSFNRASNCNDIGWQKLHLAAGAAYKDWAVQMASLVEIQARIEEQVATTQRRTVSLRPVQNVAEVKEPRERSRAAE